MKEVEFTSAPATEEEQAAAQKRRSESSLAHVRTYKKDVAELITKKKVTRTHVAIAEEERRRALGESSVWQEQKATSTIPLFITGIFLLTGISILFYSVTGKAIPLFESRGPSQSFIVPEHATRTIGMNQYTRREITEKVRAVARGEKFAQGSYIRLGFRARTGTTSLPLPIKNFFGSLEGSAPDILIRSFAPEYEAGLMSAGETKGYMIFTTTYYENTVVGLLDWEKGMFRDLYPILDPFRAELVPTAPEGAWHGEVWRGNPLRVFTTKDGRVTLVYGWINKKTLVIAGNIQIFTEAVRLITDPVK